MKSLLLIIVAVALVGGVASIGKKINKQRSKNHLGSVVEQPYPAPTSPGTQPPTTGTGDVHFAVNFAAPSAKLAENTFRTGITAYQEKSVSQVTWDKVSNEQRVGTILIDPIDQVIAPSKDFDDLKARMKILDPLVQKIVGKGGRVILVFQSVPRWLSSKPNDDTTTYSGAKMWLSVAPADYTVWQSVVKAFVNHFDNELKTNGHVLYMIGSEPENYWFGSEQDFYKYYEYGAKGALEANPNVKVGGITSVGLQASFHEPTKVATAGNKPILYNWMQYAQEHNAPIRFVTWHEYPAASPVPLGTTTWQATATKIRSWLGEFKYSNVELISTDWPDWERTQIGAFNDGAGKAAYIISGLIAAHRNNFDTTYLKLQDGSGTNANLAATNGSFGGGSGLFTKAGISKAVYNAYALISKMAGNMVDVSTNDDFIAAQGSIRGNTAYLLVSNFIPPDSVLPINTFVPGADPAAVVVEVQKKYPSKSQAEALAKGILAGTTNVDSLPFSATTKSLLKKMQEIAVTAKQRSTKTMKTVAQLNGLSAGTWNVEEYVIDATHANPYAHVADIKAKIAPFVARNDLAGAQGVIKEINDAYGIASGRLPTRQIQIDKAGFPLGFDLTPNSVHLSIFTKR